MEVFGELKNAYLEKDNAGKTALGAICCGDNITSEFDPTLTATPKVNVGNGVVAKRLVVSDELASVDSAVKAAADRVTALEQLAATGPGFSEQSGGNVFSGITFQGCYEQTTPYYRLLRLQSSSVDSSYIFCSVTLGSFLTNSLAWSAVPYQKSVLSVPRASFKCPPLAWCTDLTQADCIAAPFTEAFFSVDHTDIDNGLFFSKPDLLSPRISFNNMTSYGGAGISLVRTGSETSVIFHRGSNNDSDPSTVEFIFQGRSYKMTYATYVASVAPIAVNLTVHFKHNYFGSRDTFSFIYPNYRYFAVGSEQTVLST